MKFAVRYQSAGGNTKQMAEAIAEVLGVQAESISKPITEQCDMLFIGGGVYQWTAAKNLIKYIDNIDAVLVDQIVPFCSTAVMSSTIKAIVKAATAKNIKINSNKLCLRLGFQGHKTFTKKPSQLKKSQITKVQKWTNKVLTIK